MSRPRLSPLGTARLALGAGKPADLPDFPEDLAEIARRAEIGEERLHLAWELARLAGPSSPEGWRGRLALSLLLLDAIAEGSTRLPIGPSARQALAERARRLGLPPADLRRAEACADALLARAAADVPRQLALAFEGEPGATESLEAIVGPPDAFRPWVLEDGTLAPQRLVALETRLARRLCQRAPTPLDRDAVERALAAVAADPPRGPRGPIAPNDEQLAAVRAALAGPVAVISGGPGTGKTSIVVCILRALARIDPAIEVALAAPTGKAADRMTQSIAEALAGCADPIDAALRARAPTARTLHRLLGWSPSEQRFQHHEGSPLGERLVVLDEASMIDLALMERLVAALGPDALLVLLGDADQLPSVEPGAVLADLVGLGGTPTISVSLLTRSHRMDPSDPAGSHILGIAQRLNAGTPPTVRPGAVLEPGVIARLSSLPADGRDPPGVALLETPDPAAREAFLAWWWEHRVRGPEHEPALAERSWDLRDADARATLQRLFDRTFRARLLCVTRGRPTGADAINAWMGARASRARGGAPPLLGEPAIVVRNDHERALFNGEQGLVLRVGGRACLVVRRGPSFEAHPLEAVRHLLERAYASTVHKAQGSEHDAVALLLPTEDVPRLLGREILYTAITRARRSVLLVGPPSLIERAIARPSKRLTGLPDRLRGGSFAEVRRALRTV